MSSDLAVTIGRLNLTFEGAAGHEHRVRAISARAAAMLQVMVDHRLRQAGVDLGSRRIERLEARAEEVDMALMGDEAIARRIALATRDAVVRALGLE